MFCRTAKELNVILTYGNITLTEWKDHTVFSKQYRCGYDSRRHHRARDYTCTAEKNRHYRQGKQNDACEGCKDSESKMIMIADEFCPFCPCICKRKIQSKSLFVAMGQPDKKDKNHATRHLGHTHGQMTHRMTTESTTGVDAEDFYNLLCSEYDIATAEKVRCD